ncbi:hypothetical protein R69619_01774 [Paraburkholderia nemoris]|nr:hypothetical protein R69619_01774 [Paraburkholderia nemoris]
MTERHGNAGIVGSVPSMQPTGNSTLHRGLVLMLALLMIAHVADALKQKFVDRDCIPGRMGISGARSRYTVV